MKQAMLLSGAGLSAPSGFKILKTMMDFWKNTM